MGLATTYGRGLGFPVGLSSAGQVGSSEGPANIAESVRLILSTEPGERVMLPSFGAGLRRFLFEPNVPATHRLIEEAISRALQRWEPRIRLDAVYVTTNADSPGLARVEVRYRLIADDAQAVLGVAVPVASADRATVG